MDIPFEARPEGLYFKEGDFFIDANAPVPICLVTHAHGDHARYGHQRYVATPETVSILRYRLGPHIPATGVPYGEIFQLGKAWVSFHPAGHIYGSAQIRIETPKGVYVVSGDYKRAPDGTCLPFEIIECDLFVTESTFALPIYHWEDNQRLGEEIFNWWRENQAEKHPSLLFCYALGKAQRILSLLNEWTEEKVYLHGAIYPISKIYEQQGIKMSPFEAVSNAEKGHSFAEDLILAPPSAAGSPWLKRFPSFRTASASGWMQVRGMRRRSGLDRGFVLSDHADWDDLLKTIDATKAKVVLTAHGSSDVLARYLREMRGLEAWELKGLESTEEGE